MVDYVCWLNGWYVYVCYIKYIYDSLIIFGVRIIVGDFWFIDRLNLYIFLFEFLVLDRLGFGFIKMMVV